MRCGELLGLRWRDVDLEKRFAFLPITKNCESRGVPLSSRDVAVLRMPSSPSGRVFGSLTAEALKEAFKRAHKNLQMLKRYAHLSAGDLATRLG